MTVVRGVELRLVELALRRPVATAAGTHRERPVLLARVLTDEAEGWGESGALPGGTAVDPPLEAVRRHAVDRAVPALLRRGTLVAGAGPAARAAGSLLEMALLDATLRAEGRSLAAHLGAVRTAVPVGAVVGIPGRRDVGALLDAVARALDPAGGGAQRVRLKIGPGWDEVPLAAVRDRYADLALQADANGAYRPGDRGAAGPGALRRLEPCGLACLEQPYAPGLLAAHARLARGLAVPVCLDESLRSPTRVQAALRAGAMAVACLKPARLGGLAVTLAAAGACRAAGVGAFVGGFFETGLARRANLALAACAGFTHAGDLADPDAYLEANPFPFPPAAGGLLAVPDDPGVGAEPDGSVLEARTRWREWFERGGA